MPDGLTIAKNVIIKPQGGVAVAGATQDRKPPLDKFEFKPNVFADNTIVGDDAKVEIESATAGFTKVLKPPPPTYTIKPLMAQDVGPGWRK